MGAIGQRGHAAEMVEGAVKLLCIDPIEGVTTVITEETADIWVKEDRGPWEAEVLKHQLPYPWTTQPGARRNTWAMERPDPSCRQVQ